MDLGDFGTDDNWKQIKIDIMRTILVEKYTQCKDYQAYLDNTGKKPITENTTHSVTMPETSAQVNTQIL